MKNSSEAYKEKTSSLIRYHGAMVCSKELWHVRNPIKGAQILLPAHFDEELEIPQYVGFCHLDG